jgi:hypothetical protein
MMAYIISSIFVLTIWLAGIYILRNASLRYAALQADAGQDSAVDYLNSSLLKISEAFISCRKDFEQTSGYKLLQECRDKEFVLTNEQAEQIKKSLYISFGTFRPYICTFNGQLSETELFCFIMALLKIDNNLCGQILNMTVSSVRSCKTRLKGKLESESLRFLYSETTQK